jgi:5-formyltetrahydrofolate cyclo-ligase
LSSADVVHIRFTGEPDSVHKRPPLNHRVLGANPVTAFWKASIPPISTMTDNLPNKESNNLPDKVPNLSNGQSTTQLKAKLRTQLRTLRGELTAQDINQAGEGLAKQYLKHLAGKPYQKVAIYLQHDNEVGTAQLIKQLIAQDTELYIPKIDSDRNNHSMEFCRYYPDQQLITNHFGIAEPIKNDFIDVNALDIIFMPLTAFDIDGNRLGMGGGYYDRALAKLTNQATVLAGLAYDFQRIPLCPKEAFDQSLKIVLTPTTLIDFQA